MSGVVRAGLFVALLVAACGAPAVRDEPAAAEREDVCAALYRQLDEVLARRVAIEAEDETATREREELGRLADDIAVRIVRLDPDADVDAIVRRLEQSR